MGNEQEGRKVARQADADAPMALWYVAPGVADLRPASVSALSNDPEVSVRTLWSGISRGTERLVASGLVPVAEYDRMRAPMQEGAFPFPVKYGYCAVGIVEDGPVDLAGKTVFALHPHQDRFQASASMVTPLPARFPRDERILAANMETALNGRVGLRRRPGRPHRGDRSGRDRTSRRLICARGCREPKSPSSTSIPAGSPWLLIWKLGFASHCRGTSRSRRRVPHERPSGRPGHRPVLCRDGGHRGGNELVRRARRRCSARRRVPQPPAQAHLFAGGPGLALPPAALVLCSTPVGSAGTAGRRQAGRADHRGCGIQRSSRRDSAYPGAQVRRVSSPPSAIPDPAP